MSSNLLLLRPRIEMKRVLCSGTQCGEVLGTAGTSALEKNRGKPVWHIRPGWIFVKGILENVDYNYRSERRLLHEMIGQDKGVEGIAYVREVDLPVNVRCPKCHRIQFVVANAIRREAPGRRY